MVHIDLICVRYGIPTPNLQTAIKWHCWLQLTFDQPVSRKIRYNSPLHKLKKAYLRKPGKVSVYNDFGFFCQLLLERTIMPTSPPQKPGL